MDHWHLTYCNMVQLNDDSLINFNVEQSGTTTDWRIQPLTKTLSMDIPVKHTFKNLKISHIKPTIGDHDMQETKTRSESIIIIIWGRGGEREKWGEGDDLVLVGLDEGAAEALGDLFLVLEGLLGGGAVGVEVAQPREEDEAAQRGTRCVQH